MKTKIALGLKADILCLSGGVSAGKLDLVPSVLESQGVEQVFHKVSMKPGKPIWFGKTKTDHYVFGLPGNPVSSLVCFELFVRPAIDQIAGRSQLGLARSTAVLSQPHRQRGPRPTYFPARILDHPGEPTQVEPLPWQGSADLASLTAATALAYFPPGDRQYEAGETVEVLRLPG